MGSEEYSARLSMPSMIAESIRRTVKMVVISSLIFLVLNLGRYLDNRPGNSNWRKRPARLRIDDNEVIHPWAVTSNPVP